MSIKSIQNQTYDFTFEVIVVDDGSKFLEKLKLMFLKRVTLIFSKSNQGYLKSCNKGIFKSKGEIVLLLNNDTIAHHDWLKSALNNFSDPKIGLVGAKMVNQDNVLLEAGSLIFRDGSTLNYGRGCFPTDPRFNSIRDVDYCSGAGVLVRKSILHELGGYDERYSPAYYEDVDLAMGIRQLGYRVIYDPTFELTHVEHSSYGENQHLTDSIIKNNKTKFEQKWRKELLDYMSIDDWNENTNTGLR